MLSLFRFGYKLCRDVVIMEVSHYLWTTTMNTTLVWKESLLAIVFKKLLNIIILITSLWCHICPLYCIWHGKDCYIYVSSSVPPDFCLWLLRLHLGCGYWRNRRKKKKKKRFLSFINLRIAFPCCCLGCVKHTAHTPHGTCTAILIQEIPDRNVRVITFWNSNVGR